MNTLSLPLTIKRLFKPFLKHPFIRPTVAQLLIYFNRIKKKSGYDISYDHLQKFEGILMKHGYSLKNFNSILEFGTGHGRLIRIVQNIVPNAQLFGCDVLQESVNYAQNKNKNINFIKNDTNPPLAFDDEQFDLIFSYSVFTHLTEQSHQNWLKELSIKMKPGGIALHTVHTTECLKFMKFLSPQSIDKYELPKPIDKFIESPDDYYYVIDNPDTPEYGLALISDKYIYNKWPQYSGLEIVDFELGALQAYPEGCQDLVMLRKSK